MKKKVFWFINSKENNRYTETTWYRSIGIENFIKQVEKEYEIVGVTFSDNNIGFILGAEKSKTF